MAPIDPDPRDWISKLPGHLSLAAISIPGTHGSGCRQSNATGGWARMGPNFVATQYASTDLAAQLAMGVRFFDYRIEHDGKLRHGASQLEGNLFNEVKTMAGFVEAHRGECVCVSVKWQKEEIDFRTGGSNFDPEPEIEASWVVGMMIERCGRDRLWLEPRIPTLNEARGKVVFLSLFDTVTAEGIRYRPGENNVNNSNSPPYRSQNHYDLSDVLNTAPMDKFNSHVRPFMDLALQSKNEMHVWYFNYTCGFAGEFRGWDRLTPIDIAWDCEFQGRNLTGVNTLITRHLKEQNVVGRVGTMIMDFVNPELVKAVYSTNQFV